MLLYFGNVLVVLCVFVLFRIELIGLNLMINARVTASHISTVLSQKVL